MSSTIWKNPNRIILYLWAAKSYATLICVPLLKIHQLQGNEMTVVYKRISSDNVSESDLLFNVDSEGHLEEAIQAKKGEVSYLVNLCTDIFIIQTDRLIAALKRRAKSWRNGRSRSIFTRNDLCWKIQVYMNTLVT